MQKIALNPTRSEEQPSSLIWRQPIRTKFKYTKQRNKNSRNINNHYSTFSINLTKQYKSIYYIYIVLLIPILTETFINAHLTGHARTPVYTSLQSRSTNNDDYQYNNNSDKNQITDIYHYQQGLIQHQNNLMFQLDPTLQPITPANSDNIKPAIVVTNQLTETELVDQIESIDVTPHEIIIQTSKVGPPDMLKVSIRVVDTETWNELPSINLTGIFILVTRGRYTISFLKPNRWYGVIFRSEQHYIASSPTQPIGVTIGTGGIIDYVNEETHLIKTHKEDGSHIDADPIVSIKTKRLSNGGKSLENLIVTLKWEQHPNERPNLDAIANLTLFCKQHIKYKQVRLYGRELEKSVEVKLDNHFEIMEFYNETRQIIASITPKNCPRICWNVELLAESPDGQYFRHTVTHDCETIVAVSATTNLREYLGYDMQSGNLTIRTNFIASEPNGHEPDAYVELIAMSLPEPKGRNNNTIRYKTISVSKEDNTNFVLQHLEPNKLYAIEYKYGKESPFAYAESRRFILQTPGQKDEFVSVNVSTQHKAVLDNDTITTSHKQWPVQVIFEKIPPLPIPKKQNATNQHTTESESRNENELETKAKHKKPNVEVKQEEELNPPKIIMQLDPNFQDYEIGIDLEPFCEITTNDINKQKLSGKVQIIEEEHTIKNNTEVNSKLHFWLNRTRTNRELRHLDVIGAVCGAEPAHILCRRYASTQIFHNHMSSVEKCRLGSILCYTPTMRVAEKLYAMDKHCIDVAQRFTAQINRDWPTTTTPMSKLEEAGNRANGLTSSNLMPIIMLSLIIFKEILALKL